jgi:uncharacterized oxidoreductase
MGLAIAKAFLREGAMVAVCARSPDGLNAFSNANPTALALEADVSEVGAHQRILDAVSERFGHLGV